MSKLVSQYEHFEGGYDMSALNRRQQGVGYIISHFLLIFLYIYILGFLIECSTFNYIIITFVKILCIGKECSKWSILALH